MALVRAIKVGRVVRLNQFIEAVHLFSVSQLELFTVLKVISNYHNM